MANNQTIKERLFQYIAYKGISARSFSTECGFSANYATNISKGIPEDKMNIISVHFPDLNPSWLMTGEGTMLRTDCTSESREEAEMEETDLVRELRRQLEEERRKNEELQRKTDAQQSTINSMAKTMEMMMEEKQKSICG